MTDDTARHEAGEQDLTENEDTSPARSGIAALPTPAAASTSVQAPAYTLGQIIQDVTADFLRGAMNTDPRFIEAQLVMQTNNAISEINNRLGLKGNDRFLRLKALSFSQIAAIMIHFHHVVRIAPSKANSDRDYDLLGVYVEEGENAGIYVTSEDEILAIARRYSHEMTISSGKEVINALRIIAPRTYRTANRDFVPVNNGVFCYDTKTLIPFDPSMVFLSKSHVDYNPAALSPVIHNPDDGTDWELEEWVAELSDDPEVVNLLWEIMGAIVRPNVRWNKSAWFYSTKGNNGKGTFCELLRNVVGMNSSASIPLADFGKEFMLEPLMRASAVIVDENDVGTYVDRAANLKAIITNDVISLNRKHKAPVAYQFWGFMVQCLNEFPRIKDRSDSFYRRQLFVPFEKHFEGIERKYIKDDYLSRTEVLEYALKRVLHMNYYELSVPEVTLQVLADYKEFNDPIRMFWEEVEDLFVWDLLPFTFLYDLYKSWFGKANPSGSPVGRNQFMEDVLQVIHKSDTWYCQDKKKKQHTGARMSKPEPLIAKYDLNDWKRSGYTGSNINAMCVPDASPSYRGLLRYTTASVVVPATLTVQDDPSEDDAPAAPPDA